MSEQALNIVIVNYNSVHVLGACLDSLRGQDISRIIVVDNNSTQDTHEDLLALRAKFTQVEVLLLDANLGFAGGVNAGVTALNLDEEEVVFVLNPDTVADPGLVESILSALGNGVASIVAPVILTGLPPSSEIWFGGGQVDVTTGRVRHLSAGADYDDRFIPADSNFLSGAAIAMSMGTWRGLGGLREDLFMYWEDVDFCLRARGQGLNLAVIGGAILWHLEGASGGAASGRSALYYYYTSRNRMLICAPFSSRMSIVFLSGGLQTARMQMAPWLRESTGRLSKGRAAFAGLLDGWRLSGSLGRPNLGIRQQEVSPKA